MNWEQAKTEMLKGNKVSHQYFSSNEWMIIKDGLLLFEDGVQCSISEFFKWRPSGFFDGYILF